MASPEVLALQDTADRPQDLTLSLFASRTVIKLKSRQALKGEVQSMRYLHEKVSYAPKELNDFSSLYRQKSRDSAWKWILRV